ncbi:MAG: hypothetical protein ACRC0Y_11205 [Fusobacteriaceae bacterium]
MIIFLIDSFTLDINRKYINKNKYIKNTTLIKKEDGNSSLYKNKKNKNKKLIKIFKRIIDFLQIDIITAQAAIKK